MTAEQKKTLGVFLVVVLILSFCIFFFLNLGRSQGKAEGSKITAAQYSGVLNACYQCAPQCKPTPEPDK